jgi:hypothetical protein
MRVLPFKRRENRKGRKMSRRCSGVVAGFLMAVLAVVILAGPANAVPAFSRRAEGVSCTMCHWHPNALNQTGKDYLRQGTRLPGEEASVVSAETQFSHYASFILAPSISAVEDGGTRFSAGDAVLWLGGPVDAKFSGLAEVEFKIDDEEVEVEEVYVQYVSTPDTRYFSARMGQFQPLLFLTNVSGPPRITLSRPAAMSGRATNGNRFRPRDRVRGVEVGAVGGPVDVYLGLGNGTGQNAADNHMDVYLTAEYDIGTQGSSVGAWAYWGEAVLEGDFRDSFNDSATTEIYTAQQVRAVGGLLVGENDDPSGVKLDNDGWFLEVDVKVRPGTALYARWDDFSRDLAAGGEVETDGLTAGVSWRPTEVTRVTVEAQWLDTDGTSQDSVTAEVHISF